MCEKSINKGRKIKIIFDFALSGKVDFFVSEIRCVILKRYFSCKYIDSIVCIIKNIYNFARVVKIKKFFN